MIRFLINVKSAGVRVSETRQEITRYRMTVTARLEKTLPIMPGRRTTGTKIMIVVSVDPMTAGALLY